MNVVLARARDAESIARMSRDAIEHGFTWRWRTERVAACIANPDINVAVIRDAARVVGFGLMHYEQELAHLLLLAVATRHRRRGLGAKLLDWLETSARVAGIGEVRVEVRLGNLDAQRFYARLGYREMVRLKGYYQGREDALRMNKDLWCSVATDP